MKKKLFSVLLSLAMVVTMMPMATMTAFAETKWSGTGDGTQGNPWQIGTPTASDVAAYLDGTTLHIKGTGAMMDFEHEDCQPWADNRNSITALNIGSGVTSIGKRAFQNLQHIESINLPVGLTSIGSSAFAECKGMTSITIPSSVKTIEDAAFFECVELESITIPDSVESIGPAILLMCEGLNSVTLPTGLTNIPDGMFMGCSKLESITLPASVTSIGDFAFAESTNLTTITVNATKPSTLGSAAIPQSVAAIYVPAVSVDEYIKADGWKEYANIIVGAATAHDLSVTKADGGDAVLGEDYEWDTTDSNMLIIKENGLTVSGTTEKEYIFVNSDVTVITIKDLSIEIEGNNAIIVDGTSGERTLTVKGTNTLSAKNVVIQLNAKTTINGDGNLALTSSAGSCMRGSNAVILDCSGMITADSLSTVIWTQSGLEFTANTGKVLLYSSEGYYGVIYSPFVPVTIAPGLELTGSATYKVDEASITGEVTFGDDLGGYWADGGTAHSMLIKRKKPEPTPTPTPTNQEKFTAYATTAKADCDALLRDGDSDAVKKLVSDAKKAIDNVKYDSTKSLEDNKVAVDIIVSELKQKVMEQRADEELTRMAKATKGNVSKIKAVKGKNKLTYRVADKGLYVAKYQIYRSTKKSSGFKKLATTSKKTYTDSKKLKKGKKYYYKVRGMVKLSTGKYTFTKYSSVRSVKAK